MTYVPETLSSSPPPSFSPMASHAACLSSASTPASLPPHDAKGSRWWSRDPAVLTHDGGRITTGKIDLYTAVERHSRLVGKTAALPPHELDVEGLLLQRLVVEPAEDVAGRVVDQLVCAPGVVHVAKLHEQREDSTLAKSLGPGDVDRSRVQVRGLDLPFRRDRTDLEEVAAVRAEPATLKTVESRDRGCRGSRRARWRGWSRRSRRRGRRFRSLSALRSARRCGSQNERD